MIVALLLVVALVGLAIGSFLNVVIYRVPRGQSLVTPPSHCPACDSPIRIRHNIPVLGWLVLRGKCADCDAGISARYPLVEAGTAVLFVLVTLYLHHLHLLAAMPAYLYFAAIGIALGLIDIEHRRLPNAIVVPSYPVLAVLLGLASALTGDWGALARAGIGAVALFAFFFGLAFVYPAGMGMGDVKLAGLVGAVLAYLSWSTLVIGAFAGFLVGALVGVALIVAKKAGRRSAIPFGPFMIGGALLAMPVAAPLTELYLKMLQV